jgi:hypothetical protein
MKRFKLRCEDSNEHHTKFTLFDAAGANCGRITVRTEDVWDLIGKFNWDGTVDWNSITPCDRAEEG